MPFPRLRQYRIDRKICKKFCFTVYEAVDRTTKQQKNIRILDSELAKDGVAVYNFLNSARFTKLLEHEQINKVENYGKENGYYFATCEPITTKALFLLMQEECPFSLSKVVKIITDLATVLRYAHLRGVVHGFLNPSSIFIDDDGALKVDDFCYGWVAAHFSKTGIEKISHLTYYMSPEIYFGLKQFDGRADIYSLGVILLQFIIDDISFNGYVDESIKHNYLVSSVPAASHLYPQSAELLEKILLKMLSKNPNGRYQNMNDLIKELKSIKEELPNTSIRP